MTDQTRADFEAHFQLTQRQAWQHKDGTYMYPDVQKWWEGWQAAVPVADDNGCKSCAILRRYEKTARERGYAMGKAAGNNELAQVQELLAFERKAHAETNAALTAEITRLEVLFAAAAPGAASNPLEGWDKAVAYVNQRWPAQEPAAWICIYDDGEVDYTPLRELAEAAPKAIPLYRAKD